MPPPRAEVSPPPVAAPAYYGRCAVSQGGGLWPEPGLADFTETNGRCAARQCCWPGVARARVAGAVLLITIVVEYFAISLPMISHRGDIFYSKPYSYEL